MVLRVTYDCPFCGHAVEGRGQQVCPHCHIRSRGGDVDDFDAALQGVIDARATWDKYLAENERLTGEQISAREDRMTAALYGLQSAAGELKEAAAAVWSVARLR
jgi:hypothetical protein